MRTSKAQRCRLGIAALVPRTGCIWPSCGAKTSELLTAFALLATLSACSPAKPATSGHAPPAKVADHVTESDLNTITLTAEAEARLGIEVALVERRSVAQTRSLGGDVIAPASGASAITRFSATTSMGAADLAAAQVKADGDIAAARVSVDIARTRFNRTNKLFEAGAESARARDDALAELSSAETNFKMLQSQRSLLGQSVSSLRTPARLWVRASVYSGDLKQLETSGTAQVDKLGGGSPHVGTPVAAPSTADARTSSTFVYYEVDNSDFAFQVGERVEVSVPTRIKANSLTVPWSAVLYDINGGEWVYQKVDDRTYARQRIEVLTVSGGLAVLARGPAEGTSVVSIGAPELFGTEFGVSH